jgi:hypothetical protein
LKLALAIFSRSFSLCESLYAEILRLRSSGTLRMTMLA